MNDACVTAIIAIAFSGLALDIESIAAIARFLMFIVELGGPPQ
jgi:hypothetical protein